MSATLAREARQFLFGTRHAILSTHSLKYPDYPFGSVAPFVCNQQAEPIILISTIAEHTKNIQAKPKVSLLVFDGAEDLQANARLTLIGEALPCDKNDADLRARYLRYLPQAANYFDMHDFMFYRIRVDHVRYIAGFGKMGWFEGGQLNADLMDSKLTAQENDILAHMNADHTDNLKAYCRRIHGVSAEQVEMVGIDADGFDVKCSTLAQTHHLLRFNFDRTVLNAQEARQALIALAQRCKTLP